MNLARSERSALRRSSVDTASHSHHQSGPECRAELVRVQAETHKMRRVDETVTEYLGDGDMFEDPWMLADNRDARDRVSFVGG